MAVVGCWRQGLGGMSSALTPQSLKRRLQSNEDLPSSQSTTEESKSTVNTVYATISPYQQRLLEHLNPNPPFPILLLRPLSLSDMFIRQRALERYFESRQRLDYTPIGRPFVRSSPPNISFSAYLERLFKYCQPEPVILFAIVAYTERLFQNDKLFVPQTGWHRWIVAAWLVASKAVNGDQFWTNVFWARVAGISVNELLTLELEFIKILDWHLQVSLDELRFAYTVIKHD